MIKTIALISLISMSVWVTGCAGQNANKSHIESTNDKQNIVAIQDKKEEAIAKQQISAISPNDKTSSNQSHEVFYGQWVIKRVLAYGPAGTYSSDDVKNIEGRKVLFSQEKAACFGDQIRYLDNIAINPTYQKTIVSKNEFITGYRLKLESLGVKSDSLVQVNAKDANGNGCVFFIKDNDTLILYGGGTFFELVRAGE